MDAEKRNRLGRHRIGRDVLQILKILVRDVVAAAVLQSAYASSPSKSSGPTILIPARSGYLSSSARAALSAAI